MRVEVDRIEDAEPVIDGTELGLPLAGFSMQFDGSTLRPDAPPGNRFRPNIPPLPLGSLSSSNFRHRSRQS